MTIYEKATIDAVKILQNNDEIKPENIRMYGKIAIDATKILQNNEDIEPEDAWNKACRMHTTSNSSIAKCCPKNAFLWLIRAGYIEGIKPNEFLSETTNDGYACKAYKFIMEKSITNKNELLELVMESKTHNGQVDVVLGLYKKCLLKKI